MMISNENQPLQGMRILVAEDNMLLALETKDVLQNAGADVLGPAKTLADTLALARAPYLTCAVLDVKLGCELVFSAAQVLKDRHVGIIFYTGYNDPEGLRRNWPGAQVVSKPAPAQLLIGAVNAATQLWRYGSQQDRL